MRRPFHACVTVGCLAGAVLFVAAAQAAEPKHGGILKLYHRESPGSASIHEEATYSTNVPELAASWAWGKDNTELTFRLRQGVKWHDGNPFTSKDVKCTIDMLMGKSSAKFRKN